MEDQRVHGAVILFDDINRLIDSRRGTSRINRVTSYLAQDARKLDNIFVFSAPALIWTDIRLDDLADWSIYTYFVDETEEVVWMVNDRRFFPPISFTWRHYAPPLYPIYNTEEVVTPEALGPTRTKHRRK